MWYPYMRCSSPGDRIGLRFNVSRGAGGSDFSNFSVIKHLFQGALDEGDADIRASRHDVSFADFTRFLFKYHSDALHLIEFCLGNMLHPALKLAISSQDDAQQILQKGKRVIIPRIPARASSFLLTFKPKVGSNTIKVGRKVRW